MMYRKALTRPLAVAAVVSLAVLGGLVTTAYADTASSTPAPATPAPVPAPDPCANAAHTTVCTATSTNPVNAVGNAVTAAPGAVVGSLANDATESFTRWVASGAAYVLDQTATWLQDATPPTLNSTWWNQHYASMRRLALLLMFPFLMAAVIGALAKRDPMMMVQAFMIRTPLAFILTGAAVLLAASTIAASDEMTTMVAGAGMSGDTFTFMHNLANSFTSSATGGNPIPLFLVAIAAIFTVLAGLVMFLELLLRSGVIYIALLFMPLALAASVWPGAQKWAKRLAETLVAAIMSKFVIVTVISLAAGALAADTAPKGAGSGGSGDGIGTLLTGVILLGLAAFAPYKLFRMLPAMESAAISNMEGMRQRGTGGARAAVSAPRDALDRLTRQRASEGSALSGRMTGGLGRAAGASAILMGSVAVAGASRAGMAFATNTPGAGTGGGASTGGGSPIGGAGSPQPPASSPASGPPPTHTPPSSTGAAPPGPSGG